MNNITLLLRTLSIQKNQITIVMTIFLALFFWVHAKGQCISGDCENGYGTFVAESRTYTGTFKNGRLEGKGIFRDDSDDYIYEGEWENGQQHGLGKATRQGMTYIGYWGNGYFSTNWGVSLTEMLNSQNAAYSKVIKCECLTQDEIEESYVCGHEGIKVNGRYFENLGPARYCKTTRKVLRNNTAHNVIIRAIESKGTNNYLDASFILKPGEFMYATSFDLNYRNNEGTQYLGQYYLKKKAIQKPTKDSRLPANNKKQTGSSKLPAAVTNSTNNAIREENYTGNKIIPPPLPSGVPVRQPQKPVANNYNVKVHLPKKYTGYITNSTYNKTSFSKVDLFLNDDGTLNMIGNVDDVNLFGSWDLTGYETIKNGSKTYEFTGKIEVKVPMKNITFNNQPAMRKVRIPMTWTVEITEQGMKGTYNIAAYKQSAQENGVVDLH